jgi:SAM-dependent methyltransferase
MKKDTHSSLSQNEGDGLENTYQELEVIPGLAEFAQAELEALLGGKLRLLPSEREDRVRFHYAGDPSQLLGLRRSVAVSLVRHFDIPRPKALLGHRNFESFIGLINEVLALHKAGTFKTFCISAAGSGSAVFTRIKAEIQRRTGLQCTEDVGDLALAVRRPQRLYSEVGHVQIGWEVVARLSPRPLAARRWRVCDMPGALNASVASILMSLSHPSDEDRVLNLACGSGTLLIERLALGPVHKAVGCDIDTGVLDCARANLTASGDTGTVSLVCCDAGRVPLPTRWATVCCADLPFGMLVGSHQSNEDLYPRLLEEAGRLTIAGGNLVTITQEVRLFERTLSEHETEWELIRTVPIKLPASTRASYIRPRIYLARRR